MELVMVTGYTVELTVFQGPMDLLLQLIEKEELDITKVALAQVTDQYLAYLSRMPRRDPAELSAFVLIAARLLWIKSQALLPRPPAAAEEEDEGEDLVRQLQEYRRYKEAAQQMKQWMEEGRRGFGRLAPPPLPVRKPAELEGATLDALLDALQRRIQELAPQQGLHPLAVAREVTLVDRARRIHTLLRDQPQIYFHQLLEAAPGIEEVLVTLWAVLELFKRRWITVEQEDLFGAIAIRRRDDTASEWDGGAVWWAELEDLA
jgi:segregation and condensation protein A